MAKTVHIGFDITAGGFSQNTEWLVSDYEVTDVGKFRCNIVMGTESVVEYTVDGGSNRLKLNLGNALVADCSYGFDVYVRAGDLINFRSPTDTTNQVILGIMDSIKHEG